MEHLSAQNQATPEQLQHLKSGLTTSQAPNDLQIRIICPRITQPSCTQA